MFRLIISHFQANAEQCKVHKVRTQWDPISLTDASILCNVYDASVNEMGSN